MRSVLNDYYPIVWTLVLGVCGFLALLIRKLGVLSAENEAGDENTKKHDAEAMKRGKSTATTRKNVAKESGKKNRNQTKGVIKKSEPKASGSWLLTTLKGHTGDLLDMDYSMNGKYLVSCSQDRSVLIWDFTPDLSTSTTKGRKSIRVNIEYDHATFVRWSPDTRAFIVVRAADQICQIYKVEKNNKSDKKSIKASEKLFNENASNGIVIALSIASTGKFIMTCTMENILILWDIKGVELHRYDTNLGTTQYATISPCGRYIAACGFAPEVRVWQVFPGNGDVKPLKKAFDLKGHTASVCHVAFDRNGSLIATVSKDGSWRLYEIKVDFMNKASATLLSNGVYEQVASDPVIALSPLGETLALASGNQISFFRIHLGVGILDHQVSLEGEGPIRRLLFDPMGSYLLVGANRHVTIYHNATKLRCDLLAAREKLKEGQTSATKERLTAISNECEEMLQSLGIDACSSINE